MSEDNLDPLPDRLRDWCDLVDNWSNEHAKSGKELMIEAALALETAEAAKDKLMSEIASVLSEHGYDPE